MSLTKSLVCLILNHTEKQRHMLKGLDWGFLGINNSHLAFPPNITVEWKYENESQIVTNMLTSVDLIQQQ